MNDNVSQRTVWISKEAHSRGLSDPHISRPWLLAKEIAQHLELDDTIKDEADFFADRLLDKLESALMYYQLITDDDFESRNTSQKRTIYEGLYSNLWSFYKGRMQNYLKIMGWNLDFFFCTEKSFEKNAKKFIDSNKQHEGLVKLARSQRKAWQANFGLSRNVAEHSGDYRCGVDIYENEEDAKRLFAQVCWTAETLIAYCGSYKMAEEWNLIDTDAKSTVFDSDKRYVIEHAVNTMRRESRADG